MNQRYMGLEFRSFPSDFTVGKYIFGLRGNLPFKDWRWDIYGSYDNTDLVETRTRRFCCRVCAIYSRGIRWSVDLRRRLQSVRAGHCDEHLRSVPRLLGGGRTTTLA